jgi:HlyD family secretion protein
MLSQGAKSAALVLALALVAAGFGLLKSSDVTADAAGSASVAVLAAPAEPSWVAAGPGRVEPISGEVKIPAPIAGRLQAIVVGVRDNVVKGSLLAILDDSEPRARLQAAEAEVAFRESERDSAISSSQPNQRQSAEDSVSGAQSEVWRNQIALDQLVLANAPAQAVKVASTALSESRALLAECQRALETLQKAAELPRPTRTEAALATARAERAIAYAVLEKTRVRAPREGMILAVHKLLGDTASGAADDVIVTMGDVRRLRARIEVDEGDIADISIGQRVAVRSDAFAQLEFAGTVSFIAANVRPRTLTARHSIPTAKDNALEVIVELDAAAPLLSGMRVDAFFTRTSVSTVGGEPHGAN